MRRILISSALALALTACQKEAPPAPPVAATPAPAPVAPPPKTIPTQDNHFSPEITAEDFAAHVQTLASDQFEGRKPGTVGERMTTAYIKDQFERIGLKPANNGSYFQTVPMIETTLLDKEHVVGIASKFASRNAWSRSDSSVGDSRSRVNVRYAALR